MLARHVARCGQPPPTGGSMCRNCSNCSITTPAPRPPAPAMLLILPRHARCPDQAINTRVALVTCPLTLFGTIMSVFEYKEHCYESKEEERINSKQKWASAHSLVQYEFVKYLSTTVFLEQTDHFIQSNSQLEAECHNKL